jgi:hypothetical protein
MTHRTPRRLALVALVLVLVTTGSNRTPVADAAPGIVPITDPDLVFSVPGLGRPPHLVPMTDPIFGTTITRITGDTGTPIVGPGFRGAWGADARHVYSKQQPWNADGTLLLVQNRDGGTPSRVILDGNTYLPRVGPCSNDVLYDYRWHPSRDRARTMINVDQDGRELSWFDVGTCTKVRTWTLPFAVDYGIGSGEGNPSNDGRFVALGDGSRMFVVDMDPKPPYAPWPNQRIGPVYTLLPCSLDTSDPSADCEIGNLSISPSGRYVDVKFAGGTSVTQDMHRIFEVDPVTLALRPHAMAPGSLRCDTFQERTDGWIYPLKHADMALDPFDDDEDVIIGGRSCPGSSLGRVVKVRLRDGKVTALTDPDGEPSVQHVSTRNLDRPGWAYVGYYESDGKRFSDEIVAVRLDGGAYERLAHKRSQSSGCYRCESHPVPSRDGRRILFASNWAEHCDAGCGSSGDIKDYVVSLIAATVVSGPAPPTPITGVVLEAAQPNPAVSQVSIAFALGVDEPVSLDLVDATGRRVHRQDLGRPGPGRHEARVERGRGLPAGVYWVRLHVGAATVMRKVIFVGA